MSNSFQTAQNGHRQPNGRFVPGCPGGPANPNSGPLVALKAAFVRAVTPADVEKLVARLLAIAHGPDAKTAVQAADLLMNRLRGRAKEHVEVEAVAIQAKPIPLPDLSPEEVAILSRVIAKTNGDTPLH